MNSVRETKHLEFLLSHVFQLNDTKYTNWASGQPNITSDPYNRCVMDEKDVGWTVTSCFDEHFFACEKPAGMILSSYINKIIIFVVSLLPRKKKFITRIKILQRNLIIKNKIINKIREYKFENGTYLTEQIFYLFEQIKYI